MSMKPEDYGNRYWCVRVNEEVCPTKEIFVWGNFFQINSNGDLTIIGNTKDGHDLFVLALSKGSWNCIYAASALDGYAIATEHWEDKSNVE